MKPKKTLLFTLSKLINKINEITIGWSDCICGYNVKIKNYKQMADIDEIEQF